MLFFTDRRRDHLARLLLLLLHFVEELHEKVGLSQLSQKILLTRQSISRKLSKQIQMQLCSLRNSFLTYRKALLNVSITVNQ